MNRYATKLALLAGAGLLCLFQSAAPARADGSGTAPGNNPPAATRPSGADAADVREGQESHKVTEITLERTICYGGCPVYKVVIRPDGSFTYDGRLHVERKGEHTGKLADGRFQELAKEAVRIGYADLQDSYARPIRDLPSAVTSVTIDGKRRQVHDQRGAGPAKLVEFERMIDDALAGATWDEAKGTPKGGSAR